MKPKSSEITPKALFTRRNVLMAGLTAATPIATAAGFRGAFYPGRYVRRTEKFDVPIVAPDDPALTTPDTKNTFEQITTYNNFYEFGTDKHEPVRQARGFVTRPWSVAIEGQVHEPRTWDYDDLLEKFPLEERVYRHRCVEGWSMVIPWIGFPLRSLVELARPLASARFVEFVTLHDPTRMPGQRRDVLPWPYREGLRMDEATHPLALMVVGLYGETLPPQNGAPLRLHVPWKYGFKSCKSIVGIRFVESQPRTTWQSVAPDEYGFYANVNPAVDHPRWSQKSERRIGEIGKRRTLPFNGYADQVAHLYAGMDLKVDY